MTVPERVADVPAGNDDAAAVAAPRQGRELVEVVGPLVVFVCFGALWYLLPWKLLSDRKRFLVPYPHDVVNEAFLTWEYGDSSTLAGQAGGGLSVQLSGLLSSTGIALRGLALAIVIGCGLGILMNRARWIEKALYPYAVALQAIPILAFVPLIGTVLGFTTTSRVLVCVIISLFPIIANTLFGLHSVDQSHHDLFTLHKAGRWTRLVKLELPAAMPAVLTGFRISAGLSVVGAVVGDFFFRQGEPGIGRLINRFGNSLAYEQMYGSVILASALGITVFWLFGKLGDRIVGQWAEASEQSR